MAEITIKGVLYKNIPNKKAGTKLANMLTLSNIKLSLTIEDYINSDSFYKLVNAIDINWNGIKIDENIILNDTSDLINWISSKASQTDKDYDLEHNSGLGKKTLRLKGSSNILTQEDFDQENTIYVIANDFNLAEDIIIPTGCILDFNGGSINGEYILFGNKTIVKGGKNSGNALWSGEFITENGRHISNHYKTAQKNNIRLSCPWGYYGTDKHMNDRIKFQRTIGFDYYHLTVSMDVNVDADGIPTSIIWKSRDFSIVYGNALELATAMLNCVKANKLGVFNGFKVHTESTNIDTILNSSDTQKISAFLNLYKTDLITILSTFGNYCSQVEYFYMFNEEPELMCTATNNADIYNILLDIKNTIKSYCTNAKISISACDKSSPGFGWRTYCYTPQMIALVDVIGVNFYLSDVSLLGNDTIMDNTLVDNAVTRNKANLDYYLHGILDFCITESGCSNKEVSLARGAYWRQDTTHSMDYALEAAYIYFTVLFKLMSHYENRIKYLAHWFLNPYYFEDGILKDFYGNVYQDASYAYKMINEFKNFFYE